MAAFFFCCHEHMNNQWFFKKMTGEKALSRLSEIKKGIVQKFELSPEAVGCLRLTIIDNTNVYIENHRGISEYTQKRVGINGDAFIIVIGGNGLQLERFGRDNVAICGDIRSVQYENLR